MLTPDQNWLPLLISLGIGFFLGWLVTGLPQRRKLARAQADAEDLKARLQKADTNLTASQQRELGLQENLRASEAELAAMREQMAALRRDAIPALPVTARAEEPAAGNAHTLGAMAASVGGLIAVSKQRAAELTGLGKKNAEPEPQPDAAGQAGAGAASETEPATAEQA
jgi:hypothetical protein